VLSVWETSVEKVNPIEPSADDGCNGDSHCGDNAGIRAGRPDEETIMRRLAAIAYLTMAFGFTGCTGRLVWVPSGDACSPDATCIVPATPETKTPPPPPAAPPPAAECPSPAPACAPRRTVFVRGPQQKIVVERECPPTKPEAPAPRQPEQQVTAPGTAQDVILVPRTVYVPYVAQVPTRPARLVAPVAGVQERPEAAEIAPPPTPTKLGTPTTETMKKEAPAPCPESTAPACQPTTIIEIRQMNERIDRLHRIFERLCLPGQRSRGED
jgi:hypothetical protein